MINTELHNGDCLEYMKKIPTSSIDLIITDPPYNLGKFMEERDTNCLGSELHRLDYLIMNIIGLQRYCEDKLSKGESLDSDMNVQEPVNVIYQTIISVKSLCFSSIVISTDALAYIILGHEEKNTMTFLSD